MIKDKNVLELMKLDLKSKIRMTVRGKRNTYQFSAKPNSAEGFELYVVDDKEHKNIVYGLSCRNLIEVLGVLIQDYANGIITNIKITN